MKTLAKLFAATCLIATTTACAPSPDAVCDHVIELTKKEVGEEASKLIDKADCVKSAERSKEMKGMVKYNKEAKCAVKAESLEALGACGKAE
jgi:hypothetical protein